MSEVFANNFATTIADGGDGITAVQTTVGLADAPPAALATGNWRLLVGTEIMLVTGVSGSTATVTRGAEGTSAAIASEGAAATHILTAGAIGELSQGGGNGYGAFSARPASGSAVGEIYVCTDSPINYVWDGSAWRNLVPGCGVFDALPATGWTAGNAPAEITVTYEKGLIHMASDAKDANDWAWIYRAYTAPIVVEIALTSWLETGNYTMAGIGFGDSSTPELRIALLNWGAAYSRVVAKRLTNYSTYGTDQLVNQAAPINGLYLFRIEDDETDITFSASVDGGLTWFLVFTESRTATCTNGPGSWGIGINDDSVNTRNITAAFLGYRTS